jgi:serine/threonine-protein phosphatase 2A regulatory subunit B''
MIDMICPAHNGFLTLEDFLRPDKRNQSGNGSVLALLFVCFFLTSWHGIGLLFDALFNLHKFLRFETRDPFQEKLRREDPFNCDWDRFAHMEYHRCGNVEIFSK